MKLLMVLSLAVSACTSYRSPSELLVFRRLAIRLAWATVVGVNAEICTYVCIYYGGSCAY